MRKTITKRVVDATKATGGRDALVWDNDVRGFGLRARPSGGKFYIVKYSVGRGRSRWITIGRHGAPATADPTTGQPRVWTPDVARADARRLLGVVADGKDPAAARDAAKTMPTLKDFSVRYLAEFAEVHKKPRTVGEDRGNLKRAVLPALGALRLDKVTRADVTRFHLGRRETPANANRCLALLSHMFTMAEKWGLRQDGSNPCRHVERFKETRRERFLSADELGRLGRALAEAEKGRVPSLSFEEERENKAAGGLPDPLPTLPIDPFAVAALRLLLFTGARRSEILAATWEHVDLRAGTLRVPTPKEGRPKSLRLSAPAVALLARLPRLDGNQHVIAGRRAGSHLDDIEKPWQRIRHRADLDDVRVNDLRHSFASVAVAGGASLPIIGALLGHSQPSTTQRYSHLSANPLQAAAEAVGATLESAMRQRPRKANVVAHTPRRASVKRRRA